MVPYPVDQLMPLSMKVLIGELSSGVCMYKTMCSVESKREKDRGGASCVCTAQTVYILCSSQPVLIEEKTASLHSQLLYFLKRARRHVLG